jgi:hypothetical protein
MDSGIYNLHPGHQFQCVRRTQLSTIFASLALLIGAPHLSAQSYRVTINSTASANVADDRLTLTEAVLFLNTEFATADDAPRLGRSLTAAEAAQAVRYTDDPGKHRIEFAIPGDGVHVIRPPEGGFPVLHADGVLVDGYSQSGAKPNTNPITAANNAVLKVVLDTRDQEGANGEPPPDYTLQIRARGVHVRGFSVLASPFTDNYGAYFGTGSEGGQISGCWFGISPDLQTLSGGEVAAAAFGTGGGHVIGTNGDGVEDRAEFNVIVAHAIGVMFEETRDIKVSGNFIGVLPDGITLPPEELRAELEGDAVEGADIAGTLTIGTDSDGIADTDEPNVIGGMKDDVVELYGSAEHVVFAGNRVGVGIDDATPLPIHKLFRTRAGHFRIGSNLDQIRDDVEANWIANADNFLYRHVPNAFFECRGNRITSKTGELVSNLDDSYLAQLLGRTTDLAPVLTATGEDNRVLATVPLSGPGAGGLQPAVLDFYFQTLSPEGASNLHYQGSVVDNGPFDDDPAVGSFSSVVGGWFGVGVPLSIVAVSRIQDSAGAETGPVSSPVTIRIAPTLSIAADGGNLVFRWSAPEYRLESAPSLRATEWTTVEGQSPVTLSAPEGPAFYRLRAP